jgi:hypothetical protein
MEISWVRFPSKAWCCISGFYGLSGTFSCPDIATPTKFKKKSSNLGGIEGIEGIENGI